jgi:hypothetical protein
LPLDFWNGETSIALLSGHGCCEAISRMAVLVDKKNIFFVRLGLNRGLFEQRLMESC